MESAGKRSQACGKSPEPRSGHVAVTYGDMMLVWGGYNELPNLYITENFNYRDTYLDGREVWYYNINTKIWNVWFTRNSPLGMSGSCAACVGHDMYLFGGFNRNGNSNRLYKLDLKTKTWTHLRPEGTAPSPRDKTTCWPYRDKLVFFGGFGPAPDDITAHSDIDQWCPDPSLEDWSALTWGRGWNNHLFVYSITDNTWSHVTAKQNQPCPRAAHASAVIGNRGFVFGGRFMETRMNDLHVLNLDTMTWIDSLIPVTGECPIGRSWHCMTPVSDRHLLVFGGFSTDNTPLDDVWVIDVDNKTWQQQKSLSSETRMWHTAVRGIETGEVIVYGGCSNNLLDYETQSIHSSKVFSFFFSPKTLVRLGCEAVVSHIDVLRNELNTLPNELQRRIELYLPMKISADSRNHGYNLRQRSTSLKSSAVSDLNQDV